MNTPSRQRNRLTNALDAYFRKRTLTRFIIWILLLLTGVSGFLFSYGLLKLGMDAMAIRYPVAVMAAYGVFLGLIRLWVELERGRFNPGSFEFTREVRTASENVPGSEGKRLKTSSRDWLDWLDLPRGLDIPTDQDGCLMVLLFLLLIGAVAALIVWLLNAEMLIAEGFVDTFLVVGLYRRLRVATKEHGLGMTIRKTWIKAVIAAAILGLCGSILQKSVPGAKSIGPALRELFPSGESAK